MEFQTMADNDFSALAAAITAGIAANQPARQVPFHEYMALPENREPELKRPVFQNGQPIQIRGCSADTIKHCDELEPGAYLGGVIRVTRNGQPPNEETHIDYPWSSVNERMIIYGLVSSFSDMVAKIHKEQRERAAVKR
jgi:hypothetical protein